MIDFIFWVGAVVCVVILSAIVLLIYDIVIVGLACSVSWHLWVWRDAYVNGGKLKWRKFIPSILKMWPGFMGYRKGKGAYSGNGAWSANSGYSQWHGVFDWNVDKRPEVIAVHLPSDGFRSFLGSCPKGDLCTCIGDTKTAHGRRSKCPNWTPKP